jgi:hypothetical protein
MCDTNGNYPQALFMPRFHVPNPKSGGGNVQNPGNPPGSEKACYVIAPDRHGGAKQGFRQRKVTCHAAKSNGFTAL